MKAKSSIWKYLHESGVLNTNDDALIKAKKAEYYRLYKQNWQQKKRSHQTVIQYYLTPEQLRIVALKHKGEGIALNAFMRDAALSYCSNVFCTPDRLTVNTIKEKLALLYDKVTTLVEHGILNEKDCNSLIAELTEIEARYLQALYKPPTLLEVIREEIAHNETFKQNLRTLLTE